MSKKFIFGLLAAMLLPMSAFAYTTSDLNQRLIYCTPSKNFTVGNSTMYQISGLTGSTCIYRIQYLNPSSKPDLICKVPYSKMRDMTSFNPLTIQKLRNQYCVVGIKSLDKPKTIYF